MFSRERLTAAARHGELLPGLAYLGLSIYFLFFNFQLTWLVACAGCSLFCGLVWAEGRHRVSGVAPRAPLVAACLGPFLRGVRPLLALPIPLAGSWFAGQTVLFGGPNTNFSLALWLWLASIALFIALLVPWLKIWPHNVSSAWFMRIPWLEVGLVALITIVALVVRTADIVHEPYPFAGDEGNFAVQGLEAEQGSIRNPFATGVPFGQPSLYYFVIALSYKVFGVGILGARMPSVLIGVAAVPLLYLLLRELFGRNVALAGGAFLAVYHVHIHYSRIAMNNVSAVTIAVLALYFLARALRTKQPLDFGLAGASAALSLYSYVGARAVPLVMGVWLGAAALTYRRFLRANIRGLLVLGLGFIVVALPQGLFYLEHRDEFMASYRMASIFSTGWLDHEAQIRHSTEAQVLVDQMRRAFGVLVVYGETSGNHNAGIPLLDWFGRWPFIIGGLYCLARLRQPRHQMLMSLLVLTVVLGGALTIPPPTSARLITAVPALAALTALGVVMPATFLVRWARKVRPLVTALAVTTVLLLGFLNISFYFLDYLPAERYSGGNTDITQAAGDYLVDLGDDYVAYWFGAPYIGTRDPTLAFIARDRTIVDVPEHSTSLPQVNTSKPNAVFLFLEARKAEAERIMAQCPFGTWRTFWDDHDKRELFYSYEVRDAHDCLERARLHTVRTDAWQQSATTVAENGMTCRVPTPNGPAVVRGPSPGAHDVHRQALVFGL